MTELDWQPSDPRTVHGLLGTAFLAYVYNTSDREIEAYAGGAILEAPRDAPAHHLELAVGRVASVPGMGAALYDLVLGTLAMHIEPVGTSFANALRLACGGSIDIPEQDGVVESALAIIARDVYPIYLLPPRASPFPSRFGLPHVPALYHHPQRAEFDDAVLADETLRQLFPVENDAAGWSGYILSSTGQGGTIQLRQFAEMLIRAGAEQLRGSGSTWSCEELVRCVADQVQFARDAVSGTPLQVTARVGLTGVTIPDGEDVRLPFGRLRRATFEDSLGLPSSLPGQLTHAPGPGDGAVVIDYSGNVVLETPIAYRIRLTAEPPGVTEWPPDFDDRAIVQHRIEAVQLGLLLADSGQPRASVVMAWETVSDPLQAGVSIGFQDPRGTPNLIPRALDSNACADWGAWTTRIDVGRSVGIEIAIRRTIQAASRRHDPIDALIDAVIAWENLFGSSQGEPTLRVSAAIAWLLAADASDRLDLQHKIKKLYAIRSSVVHGTKVPTGAEAAKQSRVALGLTLDALRALLRDRVDLLSDCKDGAARSARLIVGG